MNAASKTLVALDTDTAEKALRLAAQVEGEVAGFKVGLELVNAAGFGLFDDLKAQAGPDVKLFYDCKFHDIPNTVAGASRAAARRGVWMFNIHASGGSAMLKAAVLGAAEGADEAGVVKPGEAVRAGADYIVVGRPITAAPDPAHAARSINAETATARA